MRQIRLAIVVVLFCSVASPTARGQTDTPAVTAVTAPPKMLLLVHQQFQLGNAGARQKLEVASARAYDRLNVPVSWIDLQSITGPPEALFFDPLESFEELDKDYTLFGRLFVAHPELAKMQEEIEALVSAERTVIAVRRDDLGYRVSTIDLSKARFVRVLEVHLRPGHEKDFVETFKTLAAAYEKIDADMPWVVYQVNVGMPSPAFVIFVPMGALKENDGLLARGQKLLDAEGVVGADRTQQIVRDAYASTESNLYAVNPEMSHVPKEFAAGDPAFWSSKPAVSARTATPKPAPAAPPKQQ